MAAVLFRIDGISRHAWLLPDRGIYIAWSWNTKPCTIRVHLIKGIKWDITRKENKKKIFIWICQKYIIYGYHRKDYLTIMNSRRIIHSSIFFFLVTGKSRNRWSSSDSIDFDSQKHAHCCPKTWTITFLSF